MLKLIYDIRCGFKQLYMTEKDCEFELDFMFEDSSDNTKDFYDSCSDLTQSELEDIFESNGILGIIEETTEETYAHSYFEEICFEDPDHPFVPGFTKIYNLRLAYDANDKTYARRESSSMKAKDVMAVLGISRQTLCNYVKKGLIKVDSNYSGKQYRYDRESVLFLKNNKK